MIQFEKEIINFLGLPKIPVKAWDGKSAFSKGVAVVEMPSDGEAYAVCSFNPDNGDKQPHITKVFGIEPFKAIKSILVVPEYMNSVEEVKAMDLDDASKKRAEELLNEATELENEGVEDTSTKMEDLPKWIFPEISSKEQAVAWLKNWQATNRQKGRIPTTDENLRLRLYSIYMEQQKKIKK